MNTTKKIAKAMQDVSKAKTSAYDTTAVVQRIEGNTAWVHIPGGVDETPVKMTINAKQGDSVQVRVSDGSAWLVGNSSAPPTDDARANTAYNVATDANDLAESASKAATEAWGFAETARSAAVTAETHATEAKASAQNASEYAARALGNLSTVQSVTETLTWITAHGTMALTTDVALDPTHVYFVVDAGGDYVVGGVTYAIVTEPDVADIGTYYELSIDESLNNYVGTHLALTSEGLWLIPEVGGNKVLIATGGVGHTYEDAGTYIIDENDNISAQFLEDGTTIYGPSNTLIAHLGYGPGTDSGGGTSDAPYYTLGTRTGAVGNYSTAEGVNTISSGYASHAEGYGTTASSYYSHAEGYKTIASGYDSHAEGLETIASGSSSHAEGDATTASSPYSHAEGFGTTASDYHSHAEGYETIASGSSSHAEGSYTVASAASAHAQNRQTIAASKYQTALGKYNVSDSADTYAVIIGNGTSGTPSDALEVDWTGDVFLALDTTAASGTDHDLYAAITALSWQSNVIV